MNLIFSNKILFLAIIFLMCSVITFSLKNNAKRKDISSLYSRVSQESAVYDAGDVKIRKTVVKEQIEKASSSINKKGIGGKKNITENIKNGKVVHTATDSEFFDSYHTWTNTEISRYGEDLQNWHLRKELQRDLKKSEEYRVKILKKAKHEMNKL